MSTKQLAIGDCPMQTRLPFTLLYEDDKVKIFVVCSTAWWEPFKAISPYLRKNIYLLGVDYGPTTGGAIHHQNPRGFLENMEHPENYCFLSNEECTNTARRSNGFTSIFCNENTFIDTDMFNIEPVEKEYNMVICSRIKDWKGFHLASEMDNLALIASRWGIESHWGKNSDDYLKLNYTYLNERKLTPEEVCKVYNSSNVGGIFSRAEGGCKVSSEYLLCGLPVISAESIGGRDCWYDDYNSATVDCRPENEKAQAQIKQAYERIMRERKDPHIIRATHLEKMGENETTLLAHIQTIFDEHGVNTKAEDWFYQDLEKNKKRLNAGNATHNSIENIIGLLSR